MTNDKIIWTGKPVLFSRNGGSSHGLMVGKHMYTFDSSGAIDTCLPLLRGEAQQVADAVFPNGGAAMAAHARLLKKEKTNGNDSDQRSGSPGDAEKKGTS